MKICLVQYSPFYPKTGMMDAYNEVVESYHWGFAVLGHAVERKVNHFNPEAINIVFGFSIPMQLGLIDTFPADTIFVNLERYVGRTLAGTTVEYVASKYQIWDYSQGNVAALSALNPKYPVYYARTAYAPNLEKLPCDVEQDIDVLYYGVITQDRFESLREIGSQHKDLSGLSVVTLCNVWGKLRDDFIARSKVIVNLSRGDIYEIVRVSYLLANRKAVVSAYTDGLEIEADLRDVLRFVKATEMHATCEALAEDDAGRTLYAEQCYETFRQRDIRAVITEFFA